MEVFDKSRIEESARGSRHDAQRLLSYPPVPTYIAYLAFVGIVFAFVVIGFHPDSKIALLTALGVTVTCLILLAIFARFALPGLYRRFAEEELEQEREVWESERARLESRIGALDLSAQVADSLLFQSPIAIARLDSDCNVLSINDAGLKLFNREAADVIGKDDFSFIAAENRDAFRLAVSEAMVAGARRFEFRVATGSGDSVHVTGWAVPVFADDAPGGAHILCWDCSEQEGAERALRESEERYRVLVDQIPIGIYRTNRAGRILYANPALIRMLEFDSFEDLASRNLETDKMHASYKRSEFVELIEQSGEVHGLEAVWMKKDGSLIYVRESARCIRDADGTITYYEGTAENFTEQWVARRRLHETTERLQALVNASPLAICTFDFDGLVESWNRGAERIFGWTEAETLGKPLPYVPGEYRAEMADILRRVSLGEECVGIEAIRVRKDGSTVHIDISAAPLRESDGSITHGMAVLADITAKRMAEAELRAAKDAAEAANHAKSQFLANMSHELRTPMNAIIGFSEVLQDQHFGAVNDKQLKYVSNILSSGRHLLQLINDILDLSKIEASKTVLELTPVPVAATIRSVEETARVLAAKKQIHLEYDLDSTCGLVLADAARFRQILLNLLGNAIKFTPEGGRVTLLARQVGGLKKTLDISVIDTGIGISTENQDRVWIEFEQVDSSYSRSQNGTGLGLTLTRRLVEAHGGRIWVESKGEGLGSTFTVSFPLAGTSESDLDAALPLAA